MVDSQMVLTGQTAAYTLYVLVVMAVMAWFAHRVTRPGKSEGVKSAVFYSFVGFLVVCGVSLHLVTYNTIPWTPMDLNRSQITPDRVYAVTVQNHRFILPEEKLVVRVNEKVLFDVRSNDLTYGFGLFRADNSMVCQMQVLPGHKNDLLWVFDRPGTYSIRSTEYSGPAGISMIEKDAVVVVDGTQAQ